MFIGHLLCARHSVCPQAAPAHAGLSWMATTECVNVEEVFVCMGICGCVGEFAMCTAALRVSISLSLGRVWGAGKLRAASVRHDAPASPC